MNLFKWFFLMGHLVSRYRAKYHLEADLAFLTTSHNTIFEKTEEELRAEREETEKRLGRLGQNSNKVNELKERLVEIDRFLNRYGVIKNTYGKTEDELKLINTYINYLRKRCLKF